MEPEQELSIAVAPGVTKRACATQLLGPWCIEPEMFSAMWGIARTNLSAILAQKKPDAAASERSVSAQKVGKVAVIPIHGPMTKQAHSLQDLFGGTSTAEVRSALREALADSTVGSIVLHIDSPGGSVSGTGDLADDIKAAREQKPIVAYIEDLGASAAYWVASQATQVVASRHAEVGSIGVYSIIYDESEAFDKAGVKAIVVKAGEFKAIGAPGAPVTKDQVKAYQQIIDGVNEMFVKSVAEGRGADVADVRKVNTGLVYMAEEAQKLGLIDSMGSFEDALKLAAKLGGQGKVSAAVSRALAGKTIDEITSHSTREDVQALADKEAAAPSEAPAQSAKEPETSSDASASSGAGASSDVPAAVAERQTPADGTTASSGGADVSPPGAAAVQPQELRPKEESNMDPTEDPKIAAAVEAALAKRDAQAKADALTQKRSSIAAEFPHANADVLAGMNTVEALDGYAAALRGARANPLRPGAAKKTATETEADIDVFGEANRFFKGQKVLAPLAAHADGDA